MNPQASPKISPPGAEPELITRIRTGDPEAFTTLYNENRVAVSRYVAFRVNDQHLAEDLTQEVFLRALRRVGSFTWQGRDIGAWLYTIARNIIADYYKSARVKRELSVAELLDLDQAEASAEDVALRDLEAHEAHDTVTGALTHLCRNQATVLRLRFIEELSITDTATAMDRTPGAVKTMTHRALSVMGRELRATGAAA
ncbi:sigma-70 family RNA polymerase sigma factor [Streptomyces chryseus]